MPTLASLLQPPVKSVIGAAFVTQMRRVAVAVAVAVGVGVVRVVEVYQKYRGKQKCE